MRYFLLQWLIFFVTRQPLRFLTSILVCLGIPLVIALSSPPRYHSEAQIVLYEHGKSSSWWQLIEGALLVGETLPEMSLQTIQKELNSQNFRATVNKTWQKRLNSEPLFKHLKIQSSDNQLLLKVESYMDSLAPQTFLELILQKLKEFDLASHDQFLQKVLKKMEKKIALNQTTTLSPPKIKRADKQKIYQLSRKQALYQVIKDYTRLRLQLEQYRYKQLNQPLSKEKLLEYSSLLNGKKISEFKVKYRSQAFQRYQTIVDEIESILSDSLHLNKGQVAYIAHQIAQYRLFKQELTLKTDDFKEMDSFETVYQYYLKRYYQEWVNEVQVANLAMAQDINSFRVVLSPTSSEALYPFFWWTLWGGIFLWLICCTFLFRQAQLYPSVLYLKWLSEDLLSRFQFLGNFYWRKQLYDARAQLIPSDSDYTYSQLTSRLKAYYDYRTCKTLGVTSLVKGEGKSLSAIEIAWAFQKSGYKTLLVDGNFIEPGLHQYLKCVNYAGFYQLFSDDISLEDIIHKVEQLDVLSAGTHPMVIPQLNERILRLILEKISQSYERVVVDMDTFSQNQVFLSAIEGFIVVLNPEVHHVRSLIQLKSILDKNHQKCLGYLFREKTTI